MKLSTGSAIVLWWVLTSHVTGAQQSESIPSPAEFHGYELGTTYTITANLYEYYRELARRSDRVEYQEYGRSIQGRPLPVLFIGSEKHLASKDAYRERIHRLTHSLEPLPPSVLVGKNRSPPTSRPQPGNRGFKRSVFLFSLPGITTSSLRLPAPIRSC